MKFTISKTFLCMSIIFLLFSCGKEAVEPDNSALVKTSTRNSNNDPFFDLMYTYNTLNIQTDRAGTYPFVNEVMAELQNKDGNSSIFSNFKQQNIYPCWNCAEPEYIGFHNYYIPFYDITNVRLHGLLIAQEKNNENHYYYLTQSTVTQITEERTEPYSQYWSGIMTFFNLNSYGDDRDDHFSSSVSPCLWFEGQFGPVCGCPFITSTGQLSHSSCHMDDVINDPDCDSGYCPGGSGSNGSNGQEDLPFYDFDDWVSNDDDGSGGGDNSSTGGTNTNNNNNNNNNNNDPKPPWDDFCGSFDGTLSEASSTLNPDGSVDIPIFENPADLYEEQLAGFISDYGLQSQFTPKELMEFIGEECAVSNVKEVIACVKCHFISSLGLDDDENWVLMDNFSCLMKYGTSTSEFAEIDNDGLVEEDCVLPFATNVPCSEVIFSDPIPPFNKRICHIEIKMELLTLSCIPPPTESEWGKLDLSMKFEFRIPDFAFSGPFGYENNQTIVATILSDAIANAWNLIDADIKCSNAVSKRSEFRQFVIDFLQDDNVLTKDEYWGQTGYSVEVLQNYQLIVSDYSATATDLHYSENVTKCN